MAERDHRTPPGSQRLEDIRFVTVHYQALQGLALVPGLLALAFVFVTLSDSGPVSTPSWTVAALAALAAATLLAVAIGRWYRGRYGDLIPSTTHRWRTAGIVAVILAALLVSRTVPRVTGIDLPFSPELLVMSVAAIVGALLLRPLRPALMSVGVVALTIGLLPLGLWDLTATTGNKHPLSVTEPFLVTVSIGLAIVAASSHVVLARTLSPAQSS